MKRTSWLFVALLLTPMLSACGNRETKEIPCTDQQLWDQVNEECVDRLRNPNNEPTTDAGDPEDTGGENDVDMGVPEEDMAEQDMSMPGGECDRDGDGVLSIECGGEDCDDMNAQRSPNSPEFCDMVDNDCDGVNNEGIQCNFYAHSGNTLYAVDPFERSLTQLSTDLPNLQDIDTHPNGTLLGISSNGLFEYDDIRDNWFQVGEFDNNVSDPNGMAIDSTGRIFVTAQDQIYEVDIIDGQATLLGDLGQDYYSSGDCVVNKRDSLYMTSKHDEAEDYLLLVNRDNGSATEIGPIGFTRVFGLTAAWGNLYGLTDNAELIQIDSTTGEGTLVHQFPDEGLRFFGAASTPSR